MTVASLPSVNLNVNFTYENVSHPSAKLTWNWRMTKRRKKKNKKTKRRNYKMVLLSVM